MQKELRGGGVREASPMRRKHSWAWCEWQSARGQSEGAGATEGRRTRSGSHAWRCSRLRCTRGDEDARVGGRRGAEDRRLSDRARQQVA